MPLTTSTGAAVADTTISALREQLRGRLITQEDDDYVAAKAIWNSYFEKNPGAIVRCAGAADVIAAVRFAAENDVPVTMRGAGHDFSGKSSIQDGLVIDLSRQKGILVDPASSTAIAQPGLLQGEFDHETQAFGLAVTGSQESYIGVGGLTLSGGLGWLGRYRGLLSDNLIWADIVLANGELRRTSAREEPDLFWAIRGAGANFGVGVSFKYRLYPQGMCLAGLLAFPIAETPMVASALEEYNQNIPDALSTSFAFITTPEGERAVALGFVHADPGPESEQKVVAPMRKFGTRTLMDFCGPMPYLAVQRMLDENTEAGWRFYPRSFGMDRLHPEAMQILAEGFAANPSDRSLVGGGLMGGAMARLDATATAFPHRTGHLVSILSAWTDPADDEANARWTDEVYGRLLPYTNGAVYVSHLGTDSAERTPNAYGPNYDRLMMLKAKYDPQNLFRNGHNIPRS